MTKSQIFHKAHQIAKSIIVDVGNYMIAFSIALKEVYASLKQNIAQKLIDLGMSVWGQDFGKPRIYINTDDMELVFGLRVSRYGTGTVSQATLHGQKISNSQARRLLENKIYYCLIENKFVGTELEPII